MTVKNENVADEVHAEEVIQPQDEQIAQDNESQSHETQDVSPHADKEYNFRQLREGKKQLEEENNRLKDQIREISQKNSTDENIEIADDDLAEGKHLKKLYKEIRQLQTFIKQKDVETIPERLKSRFNDFDQVVTKENIEKLKTSEPELYKSITSGDDLFSKGVSAYKALKAFGIASDMAEINREKEKVSNNAKKPMSVQAIKGQGALHDANMFANGLTADLKKKLYEEMVEARKAH